MSSPDLAVDILDMQIRAGGKQILRDVSLSVERGSILGLTGPPASGKTALLRALATIQPAKAQRMLVAGADVHAYPDLVRALIGYLPQRFGVDESLNVEDYLRYCAAIHGVPARWAAQIVDDLLELVDLAGRRSEPVSGLDPSRRRWLGLAGCLVHDPEVLLLDEPLRGLDAIPIAEYVATLQDLAALGKAVILTFPPAADIPNACTAVGVLGGGVLTTGPIASSTHSQPADAAGGNWNPA